jgi:hypothetical protein
LPLVATTPVELVSKFANGVVDTGGGANANKFKMTLVLFSGAWGEMIYEKNLKQKSRDTLL